MKITLDLPDETTCMMVCYVLNEGVSLSMSTYGIGTDDMRDGAEITIRPKEGNRDE